MLALEDTHLDIIGKAQRGLGISDDALISAAEISAGALKELRDGEVDDEVLEKIAAVLNLGADALKAIAHDEWQPAPITVPDLSIFTTDYGDMLVNAYLAEDEESGEAVIFDSGADAADILEYLERQELRVPLILVTHTHGDHVFDVDRLREKTGAIVWVGDREPELQGAQTFEAGHIFRVGALTIGTRLTWGHAQGGITFVVEGLEKPVAIVGDAIFAGSAGGGKVSYADALATVRSEILSLPDETVLCPGHGPLTTVAWEKKHNPFFTE